MVINVQKIRLQIKAVDCNVIEFQWSNFDASVVVDAASVRGRFPSYFDHFRALES